MNRLHERNQVYKPTSESAVSGSSFLRRLCHCLQMPTRSWWSTKTRVFRRCESFFSMKKASSSDPDTPAVIPPSLPEPPNVPYAPAALRWITGVQFADSKLICYIHIADI